MYTCGAVVRVVDDLLELVLASVFVRPLEHPWSQAQGPGLVVRRHRARARYQLLTVAVPARLGKDDDRDRDERGLDDHGGDAERLAPIADVVGGVRQPDATTDDEAEQRAAGDPDREDPPQQAGPGQEQSGTAIPASSRIQ